MKRKGLITLAAGAALMLVLAGCSNDGAEPASAPGVSNPLVSYDTVQQAAEAMGAEVSVPTALPEGYDQDTIDVIDGTVLQVIYTDGEGILTFRTGQEQETDLMMSGNYNEYAATDEVDVGGIAVELEGDSEGDWQLANWVDEGMRYSLDSSEVLDIKVFEDIILSV